MQIIKIDESNIDDEHICCAIGNDKQNSARAQTKKNWLKERYKDGLVFKRLDQRGKVFIEYMPIEKAWKPIIGKGYMVINCLWVSGQYKGQGMSNKLLEECIRDSKAQNMHGIVVVTSTKVRPFLTDKKYYIKNGFKVVDTAVPYFELLVLNFDNNGQTPKFSEKAKNGTCNIQTGFSIIYSNQCPFMEEYALRFFNVLKKHDIECEVIKLKTYKDAQINGSPFGTLGIYYNGKFQTHELMTEGKFEKYIEEMKLMKTAPNKR